jgi:probable HAF family extracellular repeat protein
MRKAPFSVLGQSAVALSLALVGACVEQTPTGVLDLQPNAARQSSGGGPKVTSTTPSSSMQNVTLDVHVYGSGFDLGSKAQWAISGVPSPKVVTNSTLYVSSKELVANITIAADADTTLYDVIVTTASGKPGIGTELFAVTKGPSPAQIFDLGALPGAWPSFANAINAGGVIVGYSYTGSNYSGVQHAIRWTQSGPTTWTLTDLSGQITGSTTSAAYGINTNGVITGWFRTSSGADHAFLLTSGGTFTDLGVPAGMYSSIATAINAGGAVVGYAMQAPYSGSRAFYYSSGTIVELPTLSGQSIAHAIADDGTVFGYSYDASGVEHAVMWTNTGGTWTITGLAGGSYADAAAVTAFGAIAGSGCPNMGPNGCPGSRAFYWPNASTTPTFMGTLGGNTSAAYAINDSGQIAGWSYTTGGVQHAFFAASGSSALVDLGSLGGNSAPSSAGSMNANKWVVGSSRVDTRPVQSTAGTHATLWIVQ